MLSKAKIYFKLFIQNGSVCSQGLQFVYVGWSKKLWHAEKGIRALLFLAKLTSNKMDLKETAKYLQVTRQSWPMLSRGCTCPETFEELHLHASDCLHLSFFMSLFLKPSHFCLSEYMGSSFLYPPLYIFFALPMERNAHCSIFAGKDQKLWEEEPPSPEKGQLAVVSVPPKSTTDFGTLPWISPNLRFGGKSISAGCLAAQESKPMVEAR